MKCKTCNTEVGGLVELDKDKLSKFLTECVHLGSCIYDSDCHEHWDFIYMIMGVFGTPKEKVEKYPGNHKWEPSPTTGFNECVDCGLSHREYLAKFSIPKTSEVSVEDIVKLMVDYRYNVADGAIAIHRLVYGE